jgi:hypothetical protein
VVKLLIELCQSGGREDSVAPSANSIKYQLGEMRERETAFRKFRSANEYDERRV